MVTIFKKALFAAAIVAMATTVSFANDDTNNGNPENEQSPPAAVSITVTVLGPGKDCPNKGEVESDWRYPHKSQPNTWAWKSGTKAPYSNPPVTVTVTAIPPPEADITRKYFAY
jgi:hypothetical protein